MCLYTKICNVENKWGIRSLVTIAGLQSHQDPRDAAGWLTQLEYCNGQIQVLWGRQARTERRMTHLLREKVVGMHGALPWYGQ